MYEQYYAMHGAEQLLIAAAVFIFIIFLLVMITPRKSKDYRKVIMDMYVAAKLKQLAKADNLDLTEEFESFKSWSKKQRLQDSELDDVVEGEISEKIAEPVKKK